MICPVSSTYTPHIRCDAVSNEQSIILLIISYRYQNYKFCIQTGKTSNYHAKPILSGKNRHFCLIVQFSPNRHLISGIHRLSSWMYGSKIVTSPPLPHFHYTQKTAFFKAYQIRFSNRGGTLNKGMGQKSWPQGTHCLRICQTGRTPAASIHFTDFPQCVITEKVCGQPNSIILLFGTFEI